MKYCTLALVSVSITCISLVVSSTVAATPAGDFRLAPPVRLEAAGVPIDVTVGHAAPYIIDFDGDGVPSINVGAGQGDRPGDILSDCRGHVGADGASFTGVTSMATVPVLLMAELVSVAW